MPNVTPTRKDARDKVSGQARYVADMQYPGMLHAATVRTRLPGGTLRGIEFAEDLPWQEFVLVQASDIPGSNCVRMIEADQPVLVASAFRHAGEPVLLLAHEDPGMLARGLAGIKLLEEPGAGEPVFGIDAALACTREIVPDNLYREYWMRKGDIEAGAVEAELIFEGEYTTGAQEHVYIEPQGMIARMQEGNLLIEGSMQCPYYVKDAVVLATGLAEERVRIRQCTTGGGFGGKEDYPSHIAIHAGLLAMKAGGRPVRLIYSRAEDMAVTPKRHPSRTRVRIGARRSGELSFMDIDFLLDGGAYLTLSPVVLSRGVIHAPGPYRCKHVRVRGRVLASNHPPFGAFRGFGAPQSIFALEVAMDQLAARLGLDPAELRRRNALQSGDLSPTGQYMESGVDLQAVIERALDETDFRRKREAFAQWNAGHAHLKKGIGLASYYHGAGFTGNGEVNLQSRAGLRALADGRVEILSSSTEIGQGMQTTLAQIVATALGIPYEEVLVATTDTQVVPNSGPTVASRTCMVVGRILEDAAQGLLGRLQEAAALPKHHSPEDFREACADYLSRHDALVEIAQYRQPPQVHWDESRFQGAPYASYAWACHVAELEVDLVTGEVRITDFTAVQEVGRVVHPVIAAGQIEGGVAQGIGFALTEKVVWGADGQMANNRITNYIIPTSADLPPIRVCFPEPLGDQAKLAKGLGELPMDGPAPAIVNAINFALGTALSQVPVLPEDILEATSSARVA